jgi:hypothetical protein
LSHIDNKIIEKNLAKICCICDPEVDGGSKLINIKDMRPEGGVGLPIIVW